MVINFFPLSAHTGYSPAYPSILKYRSSDNCQNQFLFPCIGEVQHVLWLYAYLSLNLKKMIHMVLVGDNELNAIITL